MGGGKEESKREETTNENGKSLLDLRHTSNSERASRELSGGGAMGKVTRKGPWTKLSFYQSPFEPANQISTGDAAVGQAAVFMSSNNVT